MQKFGLYDFNVWFQNSGNVIENLPKGFNELPSESPHPDSRFANILSQHANSCVSVVCSVFECVAFV